MGDFLKSLDLHTKLGKDHVVRTKSGAATSLVAIILAICLFISEFSIYATVDVVEHMEVDPIRNANMRINFDVTFPDVPCAGISLDAMDASGQHQEDILHDVFKARLNKEGVALALPGAVEKGQMKQTVTSREALLKEKERAIEQGRTTLPPVDPGTCGDCYGAGEVGQCCNTCEEVRNVYRKRGWQFVMKGVSQCAREGLAGDLSAQLQDKEGCNIYGHLEVPKVAGHFHFAPAVQLQHAFTHAADTLSATIEAFNITHRVNALSFGDYLPVGSRSRSRRKRSRSGLYCFSPKHTQHTNRNRPL